MIIGSEKVVEYIKLTDCKHFRVYQGNNRRTPIYFYEGPGGNAACVTAFQSWAGLNNSTTQSVEYYITIYPKGKPTAVKETPEGEPAGNVKDTLIAQFYLIAPAGFAMPMQQPIGAIGSPVAAESREALIKQIREEIEREYELEDLEAENEELKQQQTAFYQNLNKIMGLISPALGGFIPGQNQNIPRTAALGNVQDMPEGATRVLDTERIRINNVIKTLKEKDPQIVSHLEKLADIATNKPVMFSQLLTMLDGM